MDVYAVGTFVPTLTRRWAATKGRGMILDTRTCPPAVVDDDDEDVIGDWIDSQRCQAVASPLSQTGRHPVAPVEAG